MPASSTALERALGEAEVRKATKMATVFAAGTALTLLLAAIDGERVSIYSDRPELRWLLPCLTAAFLLWELLVRQISKRTLVQTGRVPRALSYGTVIFENTLPAATIGASIAFVDASVLFTGPHLLLAALTIPLSALRLEGRLCVLAGGVAAVSYLALWLAVGTPGLTVYDDGIAHAIRGLLLLAAGGVAAQLARALRTSFADSLAAVEERAHVEQVFGRYLTDEVVEVLLRSPQGQQLGGTSREVTLLMSDLRDFSGLARRLGPHDVVRVLNHYLGEMTEIVQAHGGTLDEIIGDAMFVLFNAPLEQPEHALRAVECALAMQAAMDDVNAWNTAAGLPTLGMGIAVHTGEVVVGNIGSRLRQKYGVVGENVNLTARIEGEAGEGQVIASGATAAQVGDRLLAGTRRTAALKGHPEPIELVEVQGIALLSADPTRTARAPG